jgi:hypothetical protein
MFFKKGQITIFIIIGIFILLFFLIFFLYFRSLEPSKYDPEVETTLRKPFDVKYVDQYVQECLNQVSLDGLKALGLQGGYIEIPKAVNFQGNSLWYIDQANVQPSLNETIKRLQDYIKEKLVLCTDFDTINSRDDVFISYDEPKVVVFYSRKGVFVDVTYPIEINYQDSLSQFDYFSVSYELAFREMFEVATLLVNNQLKHEFNITDPLKDLDTLGYDVNYFMARDDIIVYTIKDIKQQKDGTYYTFIIASKFGRSDLIRTVKLQNNSASSEVVFPHIIYSVDRMAQLFIMSGTTMELNGADVENISVRQFYPEDVTREDITIYLTIYTDGSDSDRVRGDKIWKTKYPVYQFEPTGLRFNAPQRLIIYWDEVNFPRKGEMGMLYTNGSGWVPIPSRADYEYNFVYSDIEGFSNYTLVDCGELEQDSATVEAKIDPGTGCWVRMGIIIAAIAVITILTMGLGAAATNASSGLLFTGVSQSITLTTFGSVAWGALTTTGVVVALGGSMVAGAFINAAIGFGDDDNMITFVATCEQDITVTKEGDAEGGCEPDEGTKKATAGELIVLTSKAKKCPGFSAYICGSCDMKCTASFI